MGCSAGKLEGRKLQTSPILDVSDVKIQTVLQLSPSAEKRHTAKRAKTNRSSRHKRGDVPKKSHRHKSDKRTQDTTNNNSSKTCDPKITAKYDIKAVIGKGTYSRVLRVEHRVSRQPYALKTMEAPPGVREAFEVELSVLRRLNHPNVIRLIEAFESIGQRVYMVMELATGGSLLDRLEARGSLPEEEAKLTIRMVLEGVRYLHSLGITHRDLKPDNLLYYHPGKDSRILITDFSFASTRKPSGSPYMHTVCGTPQYIAPEIVLRKPYTCVVDLWAVGVVTYIVLSGAFPFDAEQDSHIFKLILKGQFHMTDSVWSNVSEQGKSLVVDLLQGAPLRRPTASAALLVPAAGDGARPGAPPRRPQQGPRGGRPHVTCSFFETNSLPLPSVPILIIHLHAAKENAFKKIHKL
ncbi:hypothetical protein JTE90_002190 [Oedothorax gibbosus]|uniref:Protein kinase domain-containing protein n=1 Tax=Oedothorax gibbosus TaxID=931172 RepID=A0AAV6VI58_9ARAC|nr:hypothetical protein JTE90_002190 [Oedothorax gibbosus]